MRTHKSDENMSDCEFHDHHKSIFVAPDVKDIVLIPNVVSCWEVCLYIRQVFPFVFYKTKPTLTMNSGALKSKCPKMRSK